MHERFGPRRRYDHLVITSFDILVFCFKVESTFLSDFRGKLHFILYNMVLNVCDVIVQIYC